MSAARQGILAILGSAFIWGLSPLYYKALSHVPPLELLAHRVLWSVVFFVLLLGLQRRIGALWMALCQCRSALITLVAALLLGLNWFVFINSIQIEKATEASLGYFIFPLVVASLGWLAFGERLSKVQYIALALVTLAVGLITLAEGGLPWISLLIAISFGLYGCVKKKISNGPVVSVTAEVLLLTPLAALVLLTIHGAGAGSFGRFLLDDVLLISSGLLTATPLILFAFAAKHISMATLGLMTYLNPILQFICATVIFLEPIRPLEIFSFGLIWVALALYSAEGFRLEKTKS